MADRPPFDGLDPDLLDRYLAGACSEEETAAVRRWFMAHPGEQRRLSEFLARLDDERLAPAPPSIAASWQGIRARMERTEQGTEQGPASETSSPSRRTAAPAPRAHPLGTRRQRVAAAAVAACALLAGGLAYVARHTEPTVAAEPRMTYVTDVREQSVLRLPDGTRVRLAPSSHLRVATDFGVERRDVYLDGEAYFEVVHDEARPFTVYAGSTSVRDIGTAFSVRGYAADSAVQVVVREGEVAVLGVGRLKAGDVARVTTAGTAAVRRGVAVDSLLDWTAGRLVYSDARLGAVLEDLHRWYGVDVTLADSSTAQLLFTGALADVPPNEAVDEVAAALGLDVRREGDRLVLVPNARRTPPSP